MPRPSWSSGRRSVRPDLLQELTAEIGRLKARLEALEDSPWLHPKDVMALLGISKATLYRWLKDRRIPAPVRVHGPIWRRADLARLKGRTSGRTP